MPRWTRLPPSSRRRCEEIVAKRLGRGKTVWVMRCGERSRWIYKKFDMTRCTAHKERLEMVVAAAKETVQKYFARQA